jgi:MFS family permease
MNRPGTVIAFINAAHFIDHYAMLIFAAAVVVMAAEFGLGFGELLPYATPGFIAFGAGSLATGWLGDRWSRRHMLAVFFFGIGASLVGAGLVRNPLQLGIALFAIGLFASIYHPVGTAMLVAHARTLGRDVGINGVWGNLGVALSALVTGVVAEVVGWRAAFILPGMASLALGFWFMARVRHEPRAPAGAGAKGARVPRALMARVMAALVITVIGSSTTFNALTVALPQLFSERLADITASPALLGLIAAGVYVCGALAQYMIGGLIDRHALKWVFLPLALGMAPLLYLAASQGGVFLILVAMLIIAVMFGQVTVNDAMVGRYTSDEWRSRAFAARYFIGFTAAGASVGLVAALHARGGFALMLQGLALLSLLVILAALIFPLDRSSPSGAP